MSIVPQESCLKKKRKEEVTGHGAYTELNKTCSDKNKGMIKEERKKKKNTREAKVLKILHLWHQYR